ncbi:hypothetical protein GCG54_00005657 [Colletotrichum gloeosporioides]|uniref:Nephrocystin 3-like N-terminal domain-containing protein n=1 Tax=Colletotrichum gloeosporioides TaxID=474922 RepID=A0A8H4CKE8_COLGL|nr:uncharacterized protein GCG54_00005657 [Colletotrichum gloeosporioides]KAF3805618.1 hypothetical protein GCG54_00005657 [Colletotrichum gloeosporioides]
MPSISFDENTEYQECLQSLQFPNMHRRRDQIETALRKTNKWLWNHDDYRKWEQEGGLLWISGKPGSGKSVLAKSIQHRFRHKSNTDWSFCSWFYTSRDLEIGVRHSFMLRAIMYQILFMNKDAFLAIRPHYRDQQSHSRGQIELWSQAVLQKALVGLSRDTCMRPTIIVIDGFDESDSEPSCRAAVLDMFHELYHRPGRTRIILLSRHLPEIEKQSQGFFKILMEGCNERDINDVIRHGINELSSAWGRRLTSTQPPKTSAMGEPQTEVSDPTLRKIESYLRNNSSGVILWVRLVFREIETDFKRRTGFTEEELWRAIESLPLELESLYAHSLRRLSKSMSPEEEATAKEIFAWIVVSPNIEALQLPQLREAMALSKFIPGEDYSTKLLQDRKTLLMQTPNGELDWNHFRNIVYEHCGPLVEFVPLISQSPYEEDSRLVQSSSDISSMTAQLIHQTVDVFLRDPSRSGSWFIDQQEVERKIANISHGYLGIGKSSRPTPKRLMADQLINSHIHGHFGALKKNFSNVMSTPFELLAMDEYQRLRPLASFALATISRLNSYQHSVVEALELIDNKLKIEDRLVTYCMPDLLFTPPALGTSLKRITREPSSRGETWR